MKTEINEISVNGTTYIPKVSVVETSKDVVMVRSETAGVFFGQMVTNKIEIGVVEMKDVRRVWYWSGAASLSQLAIEGTKKPNECKIPVATPSQTIAKVIEIIPMTDAAIKSLMGVPVWKQ